MSGPADSTKYVTRKNIQWTDSLYERLSVISIIYYTTIVQITQGKNEFPPFILLRLPAVCNISRDQAGTLHKDVIYFGNNLLMQKQERRKNPTPPPPTPGLRPPGDWSEFKGNGDRREMKSSTHTDGDEEEEEEEEEETLGGGGGSHLTLHRAPV